MTKSNDRTRHARLTVERLEERASPTSLTTAQAAASLAAQVGVDQTAHTPHYVVAAASRQETTSPGGWSIKDAYSLLRGESHIVADASQGGPRAVAPATAVVLVPSSSAGWGDVAEPFTLDTATVAAPRSQRINPPSAEPDSPGGHDSGAATGMPTLGSPSPTAAAGPAAAAHGDQTVQAAQFLAGIAPAAAQVAGQAVPPAAGSSVPGNVSPAVGPSSLVASGSHAAVGSGEVFATPLPVSSPNASPAAGGTTGAGGQPVGFDAPQGPSSPPPRVYPSPIIATGTDVGAQPLVRVWDALTGTLKYQFMAYDPSFRGGVRVAMADLTGDGMPEIITAPGPGGSGQVRVFDGRDGTPLPGPLGGFSAAYDPSYHGGLYVAAGIVTADGNESIIVGPDVGGGSQVKVFSGKDASLVTSFNAYGPGFQSGVRVAVGAFTGAVPEQVVVAPGPGSAPVVHVIDVGTGQPVAGPMGSVMAYEPSFRGGVYAAAGDVENKGRFDLILGPGAGHSPEVKVISSSSGAVVQDYQAYDSSTRYGVRVGSAFIEAGPNASVVTAQGSGSTPEVRVFSGATTQQLPPQAGDFQAYDAPYANGVFVAASNDPGVAVTTTPAAQTVPSGSVVKAEMDWSGNAPPAQSGNQFQARFDWGDGTIDTYTGSPTQTGSWVKTHIYSTTGTYLIKATVSYVTGLFQRVSGEGDGEVTVANNVPPAVSPEDGTCDCANGAGDEITDDVNAVGPTERTMTTNPVRYFDGVARIATTDVSSDGYGLPWGQTRSWSNGTGYSNGSVNGTGWVDTQLPSLQKAGSLNSLVLVSNSTTARYYDNTTGSYKPRFYDQSQLVYDSSNSQYVQTDSSGNQMRFYDFSAAWPAGQQGQFASYTDRNGNTTTVTAHTASGAVAEVQRSVTVGGTTTTESFLYSYISSGVNSGLLQSVVLRRQVNGGAWTVVRQVQYAYYDGTQSYGNAGDLMTATVQDGSGNTIDTSYYRYYTPADAGSIGYVHGLKYVFTPASYARLVAVAGNPQTATDSQVSPYADNYFQYDTQHRVTEEVAQGEGCSACSGGLGTFTYSYVTSSNAPGPNSWAVKTTETLPDGNQNISYTNYAGQVMLSIYHDATSGLNWDTFDRYNAQSQVVLRAEPSAVTGYDDTKPDLLNNQGGTYQYLSNNSGLIYTYDYYTSTTATETTAGGVTGFFQDSKLQQGQSGTAIVQETLQYFTHTAGTATIHPVATDTVYRNTDGTGAQTTSYAYTYFTGTVQLQSVTLTKPVISAAQNGPAVADSGTTFNDSYGRPVWHKDADGFLSYTQYDPSTGAVVKTIDDVDTTKTADFQNLPSGWSTPAGGGLHLITQYVVDSLGRPTQVTSPAGNVTYTVYNDANHEMRVYPGFNSSTGLTTGPTQVIREDRSNGYTETYTMSATPHLTGGVPDGTETPANLQTLGGVYVNAAGQQVEQDDYFNLSGVTYSTAGHIGTAGTNYYVTQQGYDDRGRPDCVVSPTGTIYRTVRDGLGRLVSTWVGTNDTPASGEWGPTNNTAPSNMIQVSGMVYDAGGVGDGNLTQQTDYPGGSATPRVTQNWFDWRDRLVASKAGVQTTEDTTTHRPIVFYTYDNLDQVTQTQQYDGDGVTITVSAGVPQPPSASLLRAQRNTVFDDQGRPYQKQVFDVNPSTGAVSSTALTTNFYYDHRGDLVATSAPGGLWTKSQFDGVGRAVTTYMTDGAGGTTWAAAGSVSSDTVLEQVQTVYDADSNVIETIDRQRFHNATGTGALGSPVSGIGARVYYTASYYDSADRDIADVNVGTNGGTSWTRPSSVASSSATVLVTTTAYNAAGWAQDVTDPMGIDARTFYDNLARTTKTVQDYTDGTVTAETNATTEYGYDGSDHVVFVQADEPGGAYQKTQYVYGVTTASGSGVNSNDLLSAVQRPDPTTGNPSSSQQDVYLMNALGELSQLTDRNGNVHQLSYDVLGDVTADAVTTLGAGVDGTVRRIEYGYDTQRNLYLITSYDAATGGNIVNQVHRAFNGLRQMTTEWQSHSGAVNTSTTPAVQYAYTDLSAGNNSRLTSITYPGGYVLNYNYGSGLDSSISRVTSLSDSGGTLESYKYLGLNTVVERDHPQINVNLTFIQQAGDSNAITDGGDQYTGLDRFGRIIDQNSVNATTGTSTDRFQMGYDQDGNVTYRQNLSNAAFSELYQNDSLNQLIGFQRGTLNVTHNGLVGSASHSQSLTPDALGNVNTVTTDGTTQTRTTNQQNEITSISGAGTVSYDSNGNLTADGSGNGMVYDAWNRLVAVKQGSTTLAAYSYDGVNHRITETHGSTTRDLYFSSQWQVLEERVGGVVQARNVWSTVYVDGLVLRDQSSQGNGVLDQRLYVQQDANWNVTALVDSSGNVLERYVYDPYGAVSVLTPTWGARSVSSYNWLYLHQGGRYDPATGLYNFRERDYSPTLVRWLQNDPVGFAAGDRNLYRAVGDRPTNATDPSGLESGAYVASYTTQTKPSPRPSAVTGPTSWSYYHTGVFDPDEKAMLCRCWARLATVLPDVLNALDALYNWLGKNPRPRDPRMQQVFTWFKQAFEGSDGGVNQTAVYRVWMVYKQVLDRLKQSTTKPIRCHGIDSAEQPHAQYKPTGLLGMGQGVINMSNGLFEHGLDYCANTLLHELTHMTAGTGDPVYWTNQGFQSTHGFYIVVEWPTPENPAGVTEGWLPPTSTLINTAASFEQFFNQFQPRR
jgi:RHS repeat-associated protein